MPDGLPPCWLAFGDRTALPIAADLSSDEENPVRVKVTGHAPLDPTLLRAMLGHLPGNALGGHLGIAREEGTGTTATFRLTKPWP